MYDKVVTSVRTTNGDTNIFPINIGLHQGLALSPYLFALVIDEATRDIQGDIPSMISSRLVAWSNTGTDQATSRD
jgi:hypothetical protein